MLWVLCSWLVINLPGSFSGGIFALYSLLCRHAKFSLLPNHQTADEELSTYHNPRYSYRNLQSPTVKKFAERHKRAKTALLLLVLFGTCLLICVGFLTPAISSMCFCLSVQFHDLLTFPSASHHHCLISVLIVITCNFQFVRPLKGSKFDQANCIMVSTALWEIVLIF